MALSWAPSEKRCGHVGDSTVKKVLLLALLPLLLAGLARAEDTTATCAAGADALGVSRVGELDTVGGPLFGDQYPPSNLLQKGEVVLTFDDGPHPQYTKEILAALAAQCTKATFFNVGEMVKQFPDVAREVQAQGHTIGTHTWSHPNLGGLSLEGAKRQIESTISTEEKVLPNWVAPFFRFPYLSDPKRVREYTGEPQYCGLLHRRKLAGLPDAVAGEGASTTFSRDCKRPAAASFSSMTSTP